VHPAGSYCTDQECYLLDPCENRRGFGS